MVTVFERLQQIVSEKGYQQINFPDLKVENTSSDNPEDSLDWIDPKKGMIVDMQTANVLLTVIAALSPEHQVKAKTLLETWKGFERMVKFAWSVVK